VTLAGGVMGLVGAAWLAELMAARLLGVGPLDPLSFGTAAALAVGVALAASAGPARRAARIDVVSELR
jgi:ABC-type antimicrobial peptide transport system permease subunit